MRGTPKRQEIDRQQEQPLREPLNLNPKLNLKLRLSLHYILTWRPLLPLSSQSVKIVQTQLLLLLPLQLRVQHLPFRNMVLPVKLQRRMPRQLVSRPQPLLHRYWRMGIRT
jgi:hypothetical protein